MEERSDSPTQVFMGPLTVEEIKVHLARKKPPEMIERRATISHCNPARTIYSACPTEDYLIQQEFFNDSSDELSNSFISTYLTPNETMPNNKSTVASSAYATASESFQGKPTTNDICDLTRNSQSLHEIQELDEETYMTSPECDVIVIEDKENLHDDDSVVANNAYATAPSENFDSEPKPNDVFDLTKDSLNSDEVFGDKEDLLNDNSVEASNACVAPSESFEKKFKPDAIFDLTRDSLSPDEIQEVLDETSAMSGDKQDLPDDNSIAARNACVTPSDSFRNKFKSDDILDLTRDSLNPDEIQELPEETSAIFGDKKDLHNGNSIATSFTPSGSFENKFKPNAIFDLTRDSLRPDEIQEVLYESFAKYGNKQYLLNDNGIVASNACVTPSGSLENKLKANDILDLTRDSLSPDEIQELSNEASAISAERNAIVKKDLHNNSTVASTTLSESFGFKPKANNIIDLTRNSSSANEIQNLNNRTAEPNAIVGEHKENLYNVNSVRSESFEHKPKVNNIFTLPKHFLITEEILELNNEIHAMSVESNDFVGGDEDLHNDNSTVPSKYATPFKSFDVTTEYTSTNEMKEVNNETCTVSAKCNTSVSGDEENSSESKPNDIVCYLTRKSQNADEIRELNKGVCTSTEFNAIVSGDKANFLNDRNNVSRFENFENKSNGNDVVFDQTRSSQNTSEISEQNKEASISAEYNASTSGDKERFFEEMAKALSRNSSSFYASARGSLDTSNHKHKVSSTFPLTHITKDVGESQYLENINDVILVSSDEEDDYGDANSGILSGISENRNTFESCRDTSEIYISSDDESFEEGRNIKAEPDESLQKLNLNKSEQFMEAVDSDTSDSPEKHNNSADDLSCNYSNNSDFSNVSDNAPEIESISSSSARQSVDLQFDDTVAEMEMFLKYGADYKMPGDITDTSKTDSVSSTSSYVSNSKLPISKQKTSTEKNKKTFIPIKNHGTYTKPHQSAMPKKALSPLQHNFKIPSKRTVTLKTPDFKGVLSPIAVYIKNSPKVPQVQRVLPKPLAPGALFSKLPISTPSANKENQELPCRIYKPAKHTIVSKEAEVKLPGSVQKYIPKTISIIKHEGRIKPRGARDQMSVEEKLLLTMNDSDLSVCNSSAPFQDVSVRTIKKVIK